MIVFKTFLRVIKKSLVPIVMYTVILILFSGININNNDNNMDFMATKPDVLIINKDSNNSFTQNLINYFEKNSNVIDIPNNEEAISDAIFYRDVNFIIYIPENFARDFWDYKNPEIEIKSTGDYQASLANILLERYINNANILLRSITDEEDLLKNLNSILEKTVSISITSKLDTTSLDKATSYYNFTNYCLLAGTVFVICLVLSSFKSEHIRKRTIISSMSDKRYNFYLLISNSLFTLVLWGLYVLLSFITVGSIMFSAHGLCYIINSLVFSFCSLTIAFLIGSLINNKNAINGIVNVIALGSSFLCGAFVPAEFLPDFVLKIAHILPSYYYINNNDLIASLEKFNLKTLSPILQNMVIVLIFSAFFVIATNIISSKKRKIG